MVERGPKSRGAGEQGFLEAGATGQYASKFYWTWLPLLIVILLFFFFAALIFGWWAQAPGSSPGSLGDAFGIVTSFFTAVAFAVLITTLYQQGKQLETQQEELHLSRLEYRKMADEYRRMRVIEEARDWPVIVVEAKGWHTQEGSVLGGQTSFALDGEAVPAPQSDQTCTNWRYADLIVSNTGPRTGQVQLLVAHGSLALLEGRIMSPGIQENKTLDEARLCYPSHSIPFWAHLIVAFRTRSGVRGALHVVGTTQAPGVFRTAEIAEHVPPGKLYPPEWDGSMTWFPDDKD